MNWATCYDEKEHEGPSTDNNNSYSNNLFFCSSFSAAPLLFAFNFILHMFGSFNINCKSDRRKSDNKDWIAGRRDLKSSVQK